jgi:hypothetical protein
MNLKLPTCSRAVFYARLTLAVVLLAAFVCTTVPLASVSAGNVCRLECCAARAPHTAGSCMNGTCHAAIRLQRKIVRHTVKSTRGDELCGVKPLAALLRVTTPQASQTSPAAQESVSKIAPPCEADCGGCVAGSSSSKGKATFGAAGDPAPEVTRWFINSHHTSGLDLLSRDYSPRGPPIRFSA